MGEGGFGFVLTGVASFEASFSDVIGRRFAIVRNGHRFAYLRIGRRSESCIYVIFLYLKRPGDCRGRDRMVVGFTTMQSVPFTSNVS